MSSFVNSLRFFFLQKNCDMYICVYQNEYIRVEKRQGAENKKLSDKCALTKIFRIKCQHALDVDVHMFQGARLNSGGARYLYRT